MHKILIITGAAGFIGLNFLSSMVENSLFQYYDEIQYIDKFGYATKYNIDEFNKLYIKSHVRPVVLNTNINNLIPNSVSVFKSYIVDVVNFASESHVDTSLVSPTSIFNENAVIPSNLIAYIGLEKIRKFVQISTDEVYGDLDYHLKESYDDWFKTSSPLLPNNPYSASKAAQDCYLRSLAQTFKLNLVIVRMANQFGAFQHKEKMLPASILRALKGESIKIYGDGNNIRQWTPVSQTVKHIKKILQNENNTIVHLSARQTLLSNNEIVHMWQKILFDSYKLKTTTEYIDDRRGHDKMYAIQSSPQYDYSDLDKEFENTINHYVTRASHYNGIDHVIQIK